MRLLERNTLQYQTPRPFQPREAEEFIVQANAMERALLLGWCDTNQAELRIRSGVSWGRDYRTSVVTFNKQMTHRFEAFLASYSDTKKPKSAEPQGDPFAALAVSMLADMQVKAGDK